MLGKTLGGRYQIIRYLGGGGFGQTYLAEDWHLPGKPQCVVKRLNPKVSNPEAMQLAHRMFEREAEVMYHLGSHEQIPRLFAHFNEDQGFYLVQEFIEGQVLNKVLKPGRRLNEEQTIGLLLDVLTVLEFVHQQNVIHRDIKPSNLIRRKQDGRVVLIDFGAVKQIGITNADTQPGQTSVTISVGSSGYMPNEQLAGKPRLSSDIYALGMVGIQALTGCYPAQLPEDPRTGEVLWRDRPDADGNPIGISPEFANILSVMVRYDFRQRYQSATEALAALKELAPPSHSVIILPTIKAGSLEGYLIWVERGDELFQQQRYQEALTCYDKVVQVLPKEYLIWFKRGIALENLQRYEEAISSFDKVLQLQPEDYLAWFKRGKALEALRRYEEAIAAYDKVIQLQPDNYWAWHDRGRVLELSERYEDAAAAYGRAVHLKPDFRLAVDSRKRVLSQLEQVDELYGLQHYDEAIASCNRAIEENPNDSLAWLMRGMALENMQQYEEAVASYDRVVAIQPDDHLAWFKRGAVLEQLKRLKDAALSYTKVVQLQPENYWAWHDRGRVLEKLRRYEIALASYDKAVQVKPDFQAAIEGRQRMAIALKKSQAILKRGSRSLKVGVS